MMAQPTQSTPDSGYSTLEVPLSGQTPQTPDYSTLEVYHNSRIGGGGGGGGGGGRGDTTKEVVPYAAVESIPRRGRRILGMPLRTFVIVAVLLALVIVGAVVGGVVGSRNKNKSNDDAASGGGGNSGNATASTNKHVLAASRIAASNYTDFSGFLHRSVVFQDHNAALIVRLWDSENGTWTTVNLTQRLPGANVLAGTALGIASLDFLSIGIHVYCQLEDNSLHAYGWYGADQSSKTAWNEEVIANATGHNIRAGTSLALTWQRSTSGYAAKGNVGYWIAVYQTELGGLSLANYSGSFSSVVNANVVAVPTGMALLSEEATNDSSLSQLALLVESNGKVVEYTFSNGAWGSSPAATAVFDDVPTTSTGGSGLQLSMTQLADGDQSLSVALMPNGTLQGLWDKGSSSRVGGSMSLDGGPANVNFTAISMTFNGMFYGISGDAVYEYAVNTTDATRLTYVSTVFP